MSARWWRRLRIVGKVLIGLNLFVIVAIGAVLITLHTSWGREKLRTEIVDALNDKFAGGVEIGGLDGSVFGELVLRDVVVRDRQGRRAIVIDRLRFEIGLAALASHRIELREVVARGVAIEAYRRDDRINLAELIRPSEQSSWGLEISELSVRDARIAVDLDGDVEHIDDLTANGHVSIPARGAVATELAIAGRWRERGVGVEVGGALRATEQAIELSSAELAIGDLRIVARRVVLGDSGAVTGQLAIDVPASSIGHLVTGVGPHPSVAVQLTATAAASKGVTAVALAGTVAGAPVAGAANISMSGSRVQLAGKLSAIQLDASLLAPGSIATALDAELELAVAIDPTRDGLSLIEGTIDLRGRGRVGGTALDAFAAHVAVASGTVTVDATLRAPGGVRARLDARGGMRDDGAIAVTRAHLVARAADLQRALQGRLDLHGAVETDLAASGVIRNGVPYLDLGGHVIATAIRARTVRLERARLDVKLVGTPEYPTGTVDLAIDGGSADGSQLPRLALTARTRGDGAFAIAVRSRSDPGAPASESWAIAANAVVRLEPRGASIALASYTGRARGIPFTGRGGVLDIDNTRLSARGFQTTIGGGTVEVDGTYWRGGPRAGDFAARLTGRGVDLAAIDRGFVLAGQLGGRAGFQAELRRRRDSLQASVTGSITSLTARTGGDPIDVTFETSLASSRITLAVDARAKRIGRVRASVDVVPPRQIADPVAWSRLERGALRRLDIRANELQLAALSTALGVVPAMSGRIDGELHVTPTSVTGSLHGCDLVVSDLLAPADIDLEIGAADAGGLRATARLNVREIGGGTIAATVRLPARPLDPAAWTRLDASTVRDVQIEIDELSIDHRLAAWLGVPDGWRGRAAISADLAAGHDRATVTIVASDVVGGPLVRPVSGVITLTIDRAGVHADVIVAVAGAQIATASLQVQVDPRVIARTGIAALHRATITGELDVAPTELAPLVATFRDRVRRLQGTIRASATVSGTFDEPVVTAEIIVADAGVRRRVLLNEVRVDAGYARGVLTAAVRGAQDRGGKFVIDARGELRHLDQAVTTISATALELRPLARLAIPGLIGVKGTLDASLRVRGVDPSKADIEGRLGIRDAGLPLTDELGALHDATIDIDVHGKRARIHLDGGIESGRVTVRGDVTLRGLLPGTGAVDATVKDLWLITATAPRISGDVHADITRQDDGWKIAAELSSGDVYIPADAGRVLHPAGIPSNMVIVDGVVPVAGPRSIVVREQAGPRIELALEIRTVRVTSDMFRGRASGHLDVALGGDRLVVTGWIDVDRGDVTLFDRRYRIERAAIRFDGAIDPALDIRLVHEFPQLTLRIVVAGRLSDPQLSLSSDRGGATETQLLGFVLGGMPGEESGPSQDGAVNGVATAAVTQVLGNYVDKLFPVRIDILRYEAATSSRSGAVTIGRRLSDRLFVTWRSRVDARQDENTGEGSLEYWLSRRLMLDGVVGNRGIHGLDILWRRRW